MIKNYDTGEIYEINSLVYKFSRYLQKIDLNEDDYNVLVYYLNQLSGIAFQSIIETYAMQDILLKEKNYQQRRVISKEINIRIKEIESEYEIVEESGNVNRVIPFPKITERSKI